MIYISSPYTNKDASKTESNFIEVSNYAGLLCSQGKIAISPITYGHTLLKFVQMPSDWEFWKNFCISFLEKCTEMHVLMLDGWQESIGVREEIEYANYYNIPIKYINKN